MTYYFAHVWKKDETLLERHFKLELFDSGTNNLVQLFHHELKLYHLATTKRDWYSSFVSGEHSVLLDQIETVNKQLWRTLKNKLHDGLRSPSEIFLEYLVPDTVLHQHYQLLKFEETCRCYGCRHDLSGIKNHSAPGGCQELLSSSSD